MNGETLPNFDYKSSSLYQLGMSDGQLGFSPRAGEPDRGIYMRGWRDGWAWKNKIDESIRRGSLAA